MKTAITEMFGIEHPIVQGGMHYVGFAELAAAVSNAGGLGIITGLTQKTPELLAKEIGRCRGMTDKPFGVNLTFLPTFSAPPYPEYIAAIREGGVKIVETAGRSPEQYMSMLKAAGIKVQLAEVDTDGAEPLTSVVAAGLPLRDDVVTMGGDPARVTANAPKSVNNFFVVPKVVE